MTMVNSRIIALFALLTLHGTTEPCLAQSSQQHQATDRDTQLIVQWNATLFEVAEEFDGFMSLKGVRTAAMMHIAIHDAVNAIHQRYTTYSGADISGESHDMLVAISEAAYTVAVAEYPEYKERFASLRMDQKGSQSATRTDGRQLGRTAAESVLASRATDNWNAEVEYSWHPMSPGVYAEFAQHSGTPEGFIFGSGWAVAQPFVLPSPDHFRSPPPPDIETREYYQAFEEVKELGSFQSATRTIDQSHLAIWWKDFAENSHNRLARVIVEKEELDTIETARLFALVNIAIFDAYVNVFDNKFHYNHWRPYTAIREAATDGNEWTEPDSLWTNLHNHTYAFPSYPSAHGTACAAAMTMFADVVGNEYEFTMSNPVVDLAGPFSGKVRTNPTTRSFDSFSEAALECSMSRVYLGIHFRYDSVEGYNLGNRIGTYILNTALVKER